MTRLNLKRYRLPAWAPLAALAAGLVLAWLNFLTTAKWATLAGALHGWRKPWYGAALLVATVLTIATRRHVGRPAQLGRLASTIFLLAGIGVIVSALLSRLPPATWLQIPFKDDWPQLFQEAVNGVRLSVAGPSSAGTGGCWEVLQPPRRSRKASRHSRSSQ